MAGESAEAVARRQREKMANLARSAELWERGAEGERRTAAALAGLPRETWTVFHDLRWPGRKLANVDHVVVGPPGVFVIDSKNWSGSITVTAEVLRQNGRSRELAVAGAAEAALAIARLVPLLRPDLVKPVLSFVRDEELTGWSRDVMITSTATLVPMLLSRPAVLSPEDLRRLCLDLDAGIRSAVQQSPARPPAARPAAASRPTFPGPGVRWPVASRPKPTASRRSRKKQGLLRPLVTLVAIAVFIGSPALREGVIGSVIDLLIVDVSDQTPADKEQPRKQRCDDTQRRATPENCRP